MAGRHKWKGFIGVPLGLLLAFGSAVAACFAYGPERRQQKWVVLLLVSAPLTLWGCHHLSKYKGQNPGLAYLLFVIGLVLGTFIWAGAAHTVTTVGFVLVFGILLPATILFVLPDKNRYGHHHRRRKRHHP